MNKLLPLIFLLGISNLFSQQVDSVQINGSYYYVYPYPNAVKPYHALRNILEPSKPEESVYIQPHDDFYHLPAAAKKLIRKNSSLFFNDEFSFENDIVPPLEPLPDGKYVQYYGGYFEFDRRNRLVVDSQKIAGFFNLKNNVLDGNACWFDLAGDTVKSGQFVNGLKEGKWTLITMGNYEDQRYSNTKRFDNYFYTERYNKWNISSYLQIKSHHSTSVCYFRNGLKNGAFEKWSEGKLFSKGSFRDGKASDEWFEYERQTNGFGTVDSTVTLKSHYIFPEQRIVSHKKYIRSFIQVYDYYKVDDPISINFDRFWDIAFEDEEQENEKRKAGKNNYYYDNENFYAIAESLGIVNKYSFYEEFYPNGQLKFRLKYENGDIALEDTVFWSTGDPADIITYHPDTKQYERTTLDTRGPIEINVYDSTGTFLEQTFNLYKNKIVMIGGLPASGNNGNRYEYSAMLDLQKPGDQILYKHWHDTSSVLFERKFIADSRIITENEYSILGTKMRTSTYEFDANYNPTVGKETKYLKALSLVSTLKKQSYVPAKDSVSTTYVAPGFFQKQADGILFLHDKPFTGNVDIHISTLWKKFKAKPGKIAIYFPKYDVSDRKFYKAAKRKSGRDFRLHLLQNRHVGNIHFSNILFPFTHQMSQAVTSDYQRNNNYIALLDKDAVRFEGKMLNGKPEGTWRSYDNRNRVIVECTFANGSLEGSRKFYETARPANKYEKSEEIRYLFPGRKTHFLSETAEYKNGKLSGKATNYNWQGEITSELNYKDGMLSGPAFHDKDDFGRIYWNFENDTINGVTKLIIDDTVLRNEINVKNGLFHGEAHFFYDNASSLTMNFENGKRVGDLVRLDEKGIQRHFIHFEDGIPTEEKFWQDGQFTYEFSFINDSIRPAKPDIFSAEMSGHKRNGELAGGYVDVVLKREIDYRTRVYFPNGKIMREGVIRSENQSGLWDFYNYEGEKMYVVNYFDSLVKLNDSIEFKTFGILSALDTSGNVISKSLIIEKNEKYDCLHSDYYQIRQFYTFWQANDTLKRINGFVKNRYDNGVLQSEGMMQNGLPTGVWKFYDPMGKLNEVGEYMLGKRNGRWLKGDLEKIKYLGDICLNPNLPNLEEEIRMREKMLDILIVYYQMGKTRNSEAYGLDLNKR